MSSHERIWLDDPSVLWTPPQNLVEIWPFFKGMTQAQRFNAFTRLALYSGAILALIELDVASLAIALVIILAGGMLFVWTQGASKKKSRHKSKSRIMSRQYSAGPVTYDPYCQMAPTVGPQSGDGLFPHYAQLGPDPYYHNAALYPSNGPPPYHTSGPDMAKVTNMRQMRHVAQALEALDTNQDLRGKPLALTGAIGSQFPAIYKPSTYNNDLGNPGPFDFDRAVRSSAPRAKVLPENHLARLFNPPSEIPFDMIAYPVPDPTMTARHPFWPQSSEAGTHITQTSDCNLRMCH